MFQVFKAHFPDAVEEDFSAEPISDEDAEKLEKEWTKEMLGKEKTSATGGRKPRLLPTAVARREQEEDYDALTVAELRERAGTVASSTSTTG